MRAWLPVAALVLVVVASCRGNNPEYGLEARVSTGGNAGRGAAAIARHDCGSCHTVPGVDGAHGQVAPPLLWFAKRTYVAGVLPNTPDNLMRWIRNPKDVDPLTAMPTVGLTDQEARDVAAYLYTLR